MLMSSCQQIYDAISCEVEMKFPVTLNDLRFRFVNVFARIETKNSQIEFTT